MNHTSRTRQHISRAALSVVLICSYASVGVAVELTGCLVQEGKQVYLVSDSDENHPLAVAPCADLDSCATAETLSKLHDGDCLVGSGTRNLDQVFIQHIDSIQLKSLLGAWRSSNWQMNFQNFYSVVITDLSDGGSSAPDNYSYSLAPNPGTGWNIFLSLNNKVQAGRLNLSAETLSLQLVDANTGELLNPIILNR